MERGPTNVAYIYDLNGSSSSLGGGGGGGHSGGVANGSGGMQQQQQSPMAMGMGDMVPPADDNYCLRWNDYEKKYAETFRVLRDDEYFTDVTLATEGHSVKAHRVILSACSNYFHAILKTMSPWQHPVLLLHDVRSSDLNSLMDFIYFGQASVSQDSLQSFLRVAEKLKIKGLCETLAPLPPLPPQQQQQQSAVPLSSPAVMRSHSPQQQPMCPAGIGNFEGLLPRSPYLPEPMQQQQTQGGNLAPLGRPVASSAPPLAHQSPRARGQQPPPGGSGGRVSTETLLQHYAPTPKRPKYTMSPQSILRSQLQLKDPSDHVEVKAEPMAILSSSQEDVPSSGVNVTEFISAHENDLALQSLGHGISPQFMFSPDPSDNGGQQQQQGSHHNGPPPPVATMVSLDDKSSSSSHASSVVHHMHSHLQPPPSQQQQQHHHHHHQLQEQEHHHHHHDEPQDLTPGPQESSPPSNNGGGSSSMQSTPTATPTNNSSLVDESPTSPSPNNKKDRNSRKTCGYCHKDFHEMSLKRHIKDVHFRSQNTYVICPQCCKQYASQNSLYSHLNRVHGVKKDMMPTDLQIHMVPSSGGDGSNASSAGNGGGGNGGHSNHTTGNSTPTPQGGVGGGGGDNHHDGIMDLAQHSDNSN